MHFLEKDEVLAIHERLLNQFGGLPGIRDEGLLDSALCAPINRRHYESAAFQSARRRMHFISRGITPSWMETSAWERR